MNKKIKSICVFASSTNDIDKIYYNDAYALGIEIAKNGYGLVYGASNLGLMGEISSSARLYGSEIIGVMPERLYNLGIHPGECSKFILTKGMRERKAKMDELSQAVIALAGGFGTLEELSEMLVQKQLGYSNKPIVILNTNNYYDEMIVFFNKIINSNFAPKNAFNLFYVAKDPKDAIEYINNYEFKGTDYITEKIKSIKN